MLGLFLELHKKVQLMFVFVINCYAKDTLLQNCYFVIDFKNVVPFKYPPAAILYP